MYCRFCEGCDSPTLSSNRTTCLRCEKVILTVCPDPRCSKPPSPLKPFRWEHISCFNLGRQQVSSVPTLLRGSTQQVPKVTSTTNSSVSFVQNTIMNTSMRDFQPQQVSYEWPQDVSIFCQPPTTSLHNQNLSTNIFTSLPTPTSTQVLSSTTTLVSTPTSSLISSPVHCVTSKDQTSADEVKDKQNSTKKSQLRAPENLSLSLPINEVIGKFQQVKKTIEETETSYRHLIGDHEKLNLLKLEELHQLDESIDGALMRICQERERKLVEEKMKFAQMSGLPAFEDNPESCYIQ
eukprot:TRINITY_DN3792_c0_g1_i20.p1 TRINITY_DN3792_c0_g1~~TRINITY_DN3792_c0_g1_i20.p1  ORF type:complete len:293 (+),score=50.45 TRINITY_DN3792_c0_g1_i20:166-1044(+)